MFIKCDGFCIHNDEYRAVCIGFYRFLPDAGHVPPAVAMDVSFTSKSRFFNGKSRFLNGR